MKELQVVPETTPKGKGMTGNQFLAQKQLWANETELGPMVQIANDRDTNHTPSKLSPHPIPNRQKPEESNGQVEISQDPSCNDYWVPDINQEYRETKEAFGQTSADALHCKQLQNIEQGNTLEQRVDKVIRGWKQKTKACKPHIFDVHEQTMWTNNEVQDSPVSHGHNVDYKYKTPCNRGIYSSQTKPGGNDDSTLTPNSGNNISGDSNDLSLYSCWVCGMEGHLL